MEKLISRSSPTKLFDPLLFLAAFTLLGLGFVMVASASIPLAEGRKVAPLYYAIRHGIAAAIGLVCLIIISYLPLKLWHKIAIPLLLLSLFFLVMVFVPGLSHEVNGSRRWLFLGFLSFQPSEFCKLTLILYIASFLARYQKEVQTELSGFLKPMGILGLISVLLLLEPDFGTAVVLITTVMCMLYLGGVPLIRFLILFAILVFFLVLLSITSPYRMMRLTAFLNPWADQFNTGYQLTQSLMAFGRGGILGTGLGKSIQKLLYLPEPYTDFLYAVLAEELGLLGALFVLFGFFIFVWRTLSLGQRALKANQFFSGFLAYGIGLLIGIQAMINMGVNLGLLPTKGLTLPLMSYGGTSLIVALSALGLLLRIDFETRLQKSKLI